MKTLLLLAGMLMIHPAIHAQRRNDLKGPKAKNYKVWKSDFKASLVSSEINQQQPKVLTKKNKVASNHSNRDFRKLQQVPFRRPKGLKPKNKNPWKN